MKLWRKKSSFRYQQFGRLQYRSFLYVWFAAVIGILFYIPAIPKHIPAHAHLPFSMNTLLIIQFLSSVIFITIFAAVGATLAPRIGFRVNLADVPIKKKVFWMVLKRQFFYGVTIGFAGAIVAYFIDPDFIGYLNSYSFLSRLFGGLYEEVFMRWGLMTFIVWILWRSFQHGIGIPQNLLVYSGIFLSQILFAFGHMPALMTFGVTNPIWSVFTIFMVSLPWGWLF